MSATEAPETGTQLKGNVLVVDDNEINRFLIKKILGKWGLSLDFAENGQLAVEKVLNKSFDILLMDIQMPVLNGLEATRAIRENESYKDLPIIAITATILQDDLDDIKAAGMNDFITKPFVPAELYDKLKSLLRK